jgi:hypothetical protein
MNSLIPNSDEMPENIKWVKFWETPGRLPAEVIAGRLRVEGIPCWVWQQGAGAALGLTYGPMGRGHVMVPEEQLEHARRVMVTDFTPGISDEEARVESDLDSSEADNGGDWLSKGALAFLAVAVSPIGVAAAYVVSKFLGSKEDFDTVCPDCEIVVNLDEEEEIQGWFICPGCGRTVLIK